jgi:hypothetical protein
MTFLIMYTIEGKTFAKVTEHLTRSLKAIAKQGATITKIKEVKA